MATGPRLILDEISLPWDNQFSLSLPENFTTIGVVLKGVQAYLVGFDFDSLNHLESEFIWVQAKIPVEWHKVGAELFYVGCVVRSGVNCYLFQVAWPELIQDLPGGMGGTE